MEHSLPSPRVQVQAANLYPCFKNPQNSTHFITKY